MRKSVTVFLLLCIFFLLTPTVSRAAVTPYFIANNDTLLPFNDDTMPYVSGGEFFVSDKVFSICGVWSFRSVELELVQMYGGGKQLFFYTAQNITTDKDGNVIDCSPAKRIGGRFYVPVDAVCEYFGFEFTGPIEIPRNIIPNEQMYVLRIISKAVFNDKSFVGVNKDAIIASYNDYYYTPPPSPPPVSPQQPSSPQPTAGTESPTPSEEPSPAYNDVTVYLSFRDISAGGAGRILDTLNAPAATGFPSCFFVSAGDILAAPELIRMICGSGHSIGIWLEFGSYNEYSEASRLLFEAAKLKTVLVSSGGHEDSARETALRHGLIYIAASQDFGSAGADSYDTSVDAPDENVSSNSVSAGNVSADGASSADAFSSDGVPGDGASADSVPGVSVSPETVTDLLPTARNERVNFMFSCTDVHAQILPAILSYLNDKEYTVAKITETTAEIKGAAVSDGR